MEEIRVNDYVRTKQGVIGKVLEIDDIFAYVDREVGYIEETGTSIDYIQKRIITKHSPNIIDLIEVGDYVNGYKVRATYLEGERQYIKFEKLNDIRMYEKDIKSIVTKEQFNSIKYVIGE